MARIAHVSHFQLQAGSPSLRRAGRGTALGALLHGLSFIEAVTLRVATPVIKGFFSGLIESHQRRAERLIREMAQSDPRLNTELIAPRQHAASDD
jgi:hypothetical protein